MVKKTKALMPRAIGVNTIPTDKLKPNPHNPRRLFDEAPMKILEESIRKVGILVPLTVYQRGSDGQYIILDGQRRWMCAKKLNLNKVPVNLVEEPDIVQNIVTMFQIHKLREDWELMPTALKLQLLMKKLKARSDVKLAELTGLDIAVVSRCKKLLSYSKTFQDLMLDPDPNKRISADFFIELYTVLHDRDVRKFPWYSERDILLKLLKKYRAVDGGIKAVTDFRKVKQHITNARKSKKLPELGRKLKEFIENLELTPDHLLIREAAVTAKARSLRTKIQGIQETLEDLDPDAYAGEDEFWASLESLLRVIRKRLIDAGRRIKE